MKLLTIELGATNGGAIKNVILYSPYRHLLDKAIKLVHEDSDLSKKGNLFVRNYIALTKNSRISIRDYKFDFDGNVFNATSSLFQARRYG